jgi:hypothetical protein
MSPSQRFFKNLITIRKNDIPLGFVNEILSKLVYRGRAHPCENNWLGGLLGLFFAMEETNASDYLWDQFEALEAAPMPLGFQAEFKDHGRCRDS